MRHRLEQIVLIVSILGFSWLAMQVVHELGHVLGAMASGGAVTEVILYPTSFSRTEVYPNPSPLLVVWAGPVVGCLLPILAFLVARVVGCPGVYLFRFFAGFCLVANGLYVGIGALEGFADAGDMLLHGSPRWHLFLFGSIVAPLGLIAWHGVGERFGLGQSKGKVSRRAAFTSLALLVVLAGIEIIRG